MSAALSGDFSWQALLQRRREGLPLLAGIVNITPDSFSDGNGVIDPAERVKFALSLLDNGADLLDLGAESTRPGALEVPPETEWERLQPVLSGILQQRPDTVISVDTRHSFTAHLALQHGAQIINDVSGLEFDPAMSSVIAMHHAGVILTHSTAIPELMQTSGYILDGNSAVTVVAEKLQILLDRALSQHISRPSIMLDAGIGFGKNTTANYALLRNARMLEEKFQLPFCWAFSRKSMFKSDPDTLEKRIAATLAAAVFLASEQISLLRVHDCAAVTAALTAWRQLTSGENL